MTPFHWCRRCGRFALPNDDKWVPNGPTCTQLEAKTGARSRGRGLVVIVCTLCYHRARVFDGVDLSRPYEDQ